jgi:hypothetical protein
MFKTGGCFSSNWKILGLELCSIFCKLQVGNGGKFSGRTGSSASAGLVSGAGGGGGCGMSETFGAPAAGPPRPNSPWAHSAVASAGARCTRAASRGPGGVPAVVSTTLPPWKVAQDRSGSRPGDASQLYAVLGRFAGLGPLLVLCCIRLVLKAFQTKNRPVVGRSGRRFGAPSWLQVARSTASALRGGGLESRKNPLEAVGTASGWCGGGPYYVPARSARTSAQTPCALDPARIRF